MVKRLIQGLKSNPSALVRNAGWLMSIEIVAKASRVVTILCMAAFLTPVEYGVAILAVAFHDLFRMLMNSGTGNQVIQCSSDDLQSYCKNALTLQWLFCVAIAFAQFSIAPFLAELYDKPELTPLLQLMSLSYLLYPWVSIRVYLLHRANNMRYFSIANGSCIIAENFSIALMLYLDFGITAVAWSKLVFSAFWLVLFLRVSSGGIRFGWQTSVIKKMLGNSTHILTAELAKSGKHHLDTFVAGRLLTPELFGLYAFAKNAGVGLSQSLLNAYNGALFPYLSELNRNPDNSASRKTIIVLSLVLACTFILQSLMVPVYVPWLFNEVWQEATSIVSLLCLTAIPTLYLDTFCCYLRAKGRFGSELNVRLANLFTCATILTLWPVQHPMDFAVLVCIASCAWLIPYFGYLIYQKYTHYQSGNEPGRSKL